jgi:hypothetical protein
VPIRYEGRVTLHAPAEHFAGHVPSYWRTIEAKDERAWEFRAGDDDLGWLARRIAILGADFDVDEPRELATTCRGAGGLMRAAGPSA